MLAVRAARILSDYMMRHPALREGLAETILDFRFDPLVDELAERIADHPGLVVGREQEELRALLAARLVVLIDRLGSEPDAALFEAAVLPDTRDLHAYIFRRVVGRTRLPAAWDGRPWFRRHAPPG
jgi:hypothetical protein